MQSCSTIGISFVRTMVSVSVVFFLLSFLSFSYYVLRQQFPKSSLICSNLSPLSTWQAHFDLHLINVFIHISFTPTFTLYLSIHLCSSLPRSFLRSCSSHTCTKSYCFSVNTIVSMPYMHAGETHKRSTLPSALRDVKCNMKCLNISLTLNGSVTLLQAIWYATSIQTRRYVRWVSSLSVEWSTAITDRVPWLSSWWRRFQTQPT